MLITTDLSSGPLDEGQGHSTTQAPKRGRRPMASTSVAAVVLPALSVATASDGAAIGNLAGHLPECSKHCLDLVLENTTCSSTDLNCLCGAVWPSPVLRGCSMASCNIADSLATVNGTATACHVPLARQSPAQLQATIIFCALGITCAVARLGAPASVRGGWLQRAEGCMMVGNALLLCGTMTCLILAHSNGYGKDTWAISTSQIRTIFILIYNLELQYGLIIHLTKLSILYYYLQFFSKTAFPKLHRVICITAAATVAAGIAFTMALIFQCIPIHMFWDAFNDGVPPQTRASARCNNPNAFGWAASCIDLAFDLWLLGLPMPELCKLSLPLPKKIAVCIMFAMGSFVNVVTIPRILYLRQLKMTTNPVHDLWWVSLWATIECSSSVMVACMPGLYCTLVRLYRKSQSSTETAAVSTPRPTTGGMEEHGIQLETVTQPSTVRLVDDDDETAVSSTHYDGWQAAVSDKVKGRSEWSSVTREVTD